MSWLERFIAERICNWTLFCYGLHIFGSALIMALLVSVKMPPHYAAILAFLIGLVKEGWDVSSGHTVDIWDIVCNLIGIAIGFLMTAGYYR